MPVVSVDVRKVFNAPDYENSECYLAQLVETYQKMNPRLAVWVDENIRGKY